MRPWPIFWILLFLITWSFLTKLEAAPNQAPTQDATQALDHLPDRVPGQTAANEILQRDIINSIAFWDGFNGNKGFQGRVLNTRPLTPSLQIISEKSRERLKAFSNIAVMHGQEPPKWIREEWMIDRNGINIYYEIFLIESYAGGVDILMGRVQEVPFSD